MRSTMDARGSVSRTAGAVALVLLGCAGPSRWSASEAFVSITQSPLAARDATLDTLYRFEMVQAAPGKLLDLIELYRRRASSVVAGGDEMPFLTRHSQGDHWDLLAIYPMGSFTEYYRAERVAKRRAAIEATGVSAEEHARERYALVAWHQEEFVKGPSVDRLRSHLDGAGLVHFEMMQALAGKRDALIEERRMENTFNRERGRGETLIFVHEQGAPWDVITLGVYRDWRHYAEVDAIPRDVSDTAAKKAGFPNAAGVSPYMRSLISTHQDTLGPPLDLSR